MGSANFTPLTQSDILSSNLEGDVKEQTHKVFEKVQLLLEQVKNRFGNDSSEYLMLLQQYEKIENRMKVLINTIGQQTQQELNILKLEMSNFQKTQDNQTIQSGNIETQKTSATFVSFLDWSGNTAKNFGLTTDSISFLGDIAQKTNQYQEELLIKIMGNDREKGYNSQYLLGYNAQVGNYIMKISDFELFLRNPHVKITGEPSDPMVVNSHMLAHYMLYLYEKNPDMFGVNIRNSFSVSQLKELNELWSQMPNTLAYSKIRSALEKKENSIENMQKEGIFKYSQVITQENYKELLKKDSDNVTFIQDKKLLLQVLKENSEIKYSMIHRSLQTDIDVIESIRFNREFITAKSFNFNQIPQEFYQIDVKFPNSSGVMDVKSLFSLIDTQSEFLIIMGQLAMALSPKDLEIFTQLLEKDQNLNKIHAFIHNIRNDVKENENITKSGIIQTITRVRTGLNVQEDDVKDINIYIYKNGISGLEQELKLLFANSEIDISRYPGLQKILMSNIDFTKQLIQQRPDIYGSLNTTLQSNPEVVNTYLTCVLIQPFNYEYIIDKLEPLYIGTNIGISLLLSDKLVKSYGQQVFQNILLHPRVMQKFKILYAHLTDVEKKVLGNINTALTDVDKKVLGNIDTAFSAIRKEYASTEKVISAVHETYQKTDVVNKDEIFLQEIQRICEGFPKDIAEKFLEILSSPPSVESTPVLLGDLKKYTNGDQQKVESMLHDLQNIQIRKLEESLQQSRLELSAQNIDIVNILMRYPKGGDENEEVYKQRILNVLKEQNILLTPTLQKQITDYLMIQKDIRNVQQQQQYIKEWISYVESGSTQEFSKYLEEKNILMASDVKGTKTQDGNVSYQIEIKSNGEYTFYFENQPELTLTYDEKILIDKNPEALENVLKFRDTLTELSLEKLWHYRSGIFQAMQNQYNGVFDISDDFLNEQEMKIFLVSLCGTLGYTIDVSLPYVSVLQKVKELNYVNGFSSLQDVNVMMDSNLEDKFIAQFDPERKGIFLQYKFQEQLPNIY